MRKTSRSVQLATVFGQMCLISVWYGWFETKGSLHGKCENIETGTQVGLLKLRSAKQGVPITR